MHEPDVNGHSRSSASAPTAAPATQGWRRSSTALEIGYRHIDTAQTYDTEANVGEAIRRSGLPRAEVFVTTKVADVKLARDGFPAELRAEPRHASRVDQVDLTLIHWPSADATRCRFEDYMEELGEAQASSALTRLIGVSNFPIALLDRAVALLGPGEIATNQVEMHPFLQNRKVLERCKATRRRGHRLHAARQGPGGATIRRSAHRRASRHQRRRRSRSPGSSTRGSSSSPPPAAASTWRPISTPCPSTSPSRKPPPSPPSTAATA